MARKRRKANAQAGELNLTAMIDVAFQLLSFFVITSKPPDVMVHHDVSRPAPDKQATKNDKLELIKIEVLPDGYTLLDAVVSEQRMSSMIKEMASLNNQQTVLIMCAAQSPHERLMKVLDMCAENKLTNISVVSTN